MGAARCFLFSMDLQGTTPVQSTYYRARKLFMVLCVCGSVQVTRQQQEMGANSNQTPPPPHPGSHPCGYQLDPCWTQRNFREETTPQWRYLADYTRITTAMLHAIFTRSQYLEEATWKLEIYITAQFYETMTDMRDIKPLFPLTGSYELPVGAVHWRGTVNSKS